jgi:hypothetical protein
MTSTFLASQILWPAFFTFALVCALAGAVIAVGLIAAQGTTLRFFAQVNTWIPMRQAFKWAEVPHDTGRLVLAWRRWFATAFIVGGAFILLAVLGYFGLLRAQASSPPRIAEMLLEVLLWLMVTGGTLAITVGVMLAVAPAALTRFEAYTDRWISTRQSGRALSEGGDRMHLGLDEIVAGHARNAGWVLLALSVAGIACTSWALITR